MRPAADAFLLDTTNLDIEAAFDTAVGVITEEGWPARARLRAPLAIQLAKAHRRQNSNIMGTGGAGLRARAVAQRGQAPSGHSDAAPNRNGYRSRNEHRCQ